MGVDFNDVVFFGVWVECILDVIFFNDIEVLDNVDSGSLKYVVVCIRESLGGGDDD